MDAHLIGISVRTAAQEWMKGAAMYNNSSAELSRLRLSVETEMKIVKHLMEEAEKACAECQEFDCDGCVHREYRNG